MNSITSEPVFNLTREQFKPVPSRIKNHVFTRRYEQACEFVLPFIQKNRIDTRNFDCLEVGCGEGPKSCAFGPQFKSYVGIDIDKKSVDSARDKAAFMGVQKHVEFLHLEADRLEELFDDRQFNFVFLYAVLEHLTIEERLKTLDLIWNCLPEDGFLYIGEAPNRISPIDYHSSMIPYFHLLPTELSEKMYSASKHEGWKVRVESESSMELGFYRNGQPVGHQEFELTICPIGKMSEHIVADNYDPYMLNMNPLRWFELNTLDDFKGHETDVFLKPGPKIPAVFSRYWIDFILRKKPLTEPDRLHYPKKVRLIASKNTTISKDNLRNTLINVPAVDGLVEIDIEKNADQLLFSVGKDQLQGSLSIEADTGTILQLSLKDILEGQLNHWNKLVWRSLTLKYLTTSRLRFRYEGDRGNVVNLGPMLLR